MAMEAQAVLAVVTMTVVKGSESSWRECGRKQRLSALGRVIQLLENTAQGLQFRAKTAPVAGFQAFHGLLIPVKGFPSSTAR